MDVPIAFESEVYRNDDPVGFELLPPARQSVVPAANEMVLDLLLGGDPERSQGADRGLAHGYLRLRNLPRRRAEPSVCQRPPPPSSNPAGGHDLALEPQQRDAVGDGAAQSPTRFVLLGVFDEVRGTYRVVGGEPFENQPAGLGAHGHPRLGRSVSVGPGRGQCGMKRPVLGRNDRGSVRPVLVQAPLVPQQGVDQLGVVWTEAAEQNEQVSQVQR